MNKQSIPKPCGPRNIPRNSPRNSPRVCADGESGSASNAAISLSGVTFGYETGLAVVREVSIEATRGRVTALIGPNASGKTTLLKLMLGQLEPWAGDVRLDGKCVGTMRPRERAGLLSYVPQRSAVRFAFTVAQVVRMSRYLIGADEAAVDWAIEVCDLIAHRDKVFLTLSTGEQQRVLLARAMAQAGRQEDAADCATHEKSGRAMLLDEPASAMDLKHQHATMHRLVELAKAGLTVVVVLHDLNLAARFADDVWLMDRGRLVAGGRWDQVLTSERLEPVYGVGIGRVEREGSDRPVLLVDSVPTL